MPKLRGMAVSRRGRPALGLQTLIDRLQGKAKTRHKLSAVTVDDAEQAAHVLQRSRSSKARYRDAVLAGSFLRPVVRAAGAAVEGALAAPRGHRVQGALHGGFQDAKGVAHGLTKARLAKEVLEGGIGGAAINAGREGLETTRAKRTAASFLKEASLPPIGKRRILMHADDVWGRNTMAARNAADAAGKAREAFENAPTMLHHKPAAPAVTQAAQAAPSAVKPKKGKRRMLKAVGGVGMLGAGGLAMSGGQPQADKLASGLSFALPKLAAKLQLNKVRPVRTSKLNPIIDDEIDYEV